MKRVLLLIIILAQPLTTICQTIDVKPRLNSDDIFINTTFLQESPNIYDESLGIDYAFRFILTTYEIYDYVFIEKVTYGEEGGEKKVKWRKGLDMDIFYQLGATGEIFNIKFNKWTESESFKMTIQDIKYEVSNLNSNKWTIKRKN